RAALALAFALLACKAGPPALPAAPAWAAHRSVALSSFKRVAQNDEAHQRQAAALRSLVAADLAASGFAVKPGDADAELVVVLDEWSGPSKDAEWRWAAASAQV